MKRFSKIVSRTSDTPRAVHISAMSWACRSVGKPGKGCVSTLTGIEAVAVSRHAKAAWLLVDIDARGAQGLQRLVQEVCARAF